MMDSNTIHTAITTAFQYFQNGDSVRTEFELARLVMSNPESSVVLAAMAEFYYQNCNMQQAIPYAMKAEACITEDTTLDEVLYVSKVLCCIGEDELANKLPRNFSKGRPTDNTQTAKLAIHYLNLDLIEESVNTFNKVQESTLDDYGRAMFGTAKLYSGDVTGAKSIFINACQHNPGNAMAALQLAMLNVPDGRDKRIDAWQALCQTALPDADLSQLQFALFHEYDAINETENAIKALTKANDIRAKTQPSKSNLVTELVNDYLLQLEQINLKNKMIVTTEAPVPVFIVGLPRTGTTLLEKTLTTLADVQAVGEHLTFRKSIERQLGLVFTNPIEIANRPFAQTIDFTELGRRYCDKTRWSADGRPYYTDKDPFNYVYAGLITKAIPSARIIHIRRNPMDACFSSYKQSFAYGSFPASYGLNSMAEYYKNYHRIMAFWRASLGPRMLEIRYEDLVLQYDQTLQTIKDYCQFNETEIESQQKPYKASTLSAAQVQKPIHAGNINAWAKYSEYLQPLRTALDKEYTEYMSGIEGVEIL